MSDSKHEKTSPVTGETYEPHHALHHPERGIRNMSTVMSEIRSAK